MGVNNKSLGRFKLVGIPPAPRGTPLIQVSFDIDANGILQVTALDRTTGREQSITIQGASTLSEREVSQMIREAEKYARVDRERRDRIEKRNRAEALANQAERQLREATLEFGMQFANQYRRQIDPLVDELRESLRRNDDRGIDQVGADLQDVLYNLNREVREMLSEEEGDDFFGSIRRVFSADEDSRDERYNNNNSRNYRRPPSEPARFNQYSNSYPDDDWDDDDEWL